MTSPEKHARLEPLRVELYAISSIVADAAVRRALEDRGRYPPYGLVRSLFSDFGVISANPSSIGEGTVSDFRTLGKALIDTMVFHLDGHLKEARKSEAAWLLDQLARLLALFRLAGDRKVQARMRDTFSFIYGGLQFGTSTCVQLAEAMNRLLHPEGTASAQKAEIMKRSVRPAYDLAGVNVEDIAIAYKKLQPSSAGPQTGSPASPAGWMDPSKLELRYSQGRAWKVAIRFDIEREVEQEGLSTEDSSVRFSTLGCPARVSPGGVRSPIGLLWEWSVELAEKTGLLET